MPIPKTVAIFGGGGFIGRQLLRQLAPLGIVSRVATRDPTGIEIPPSVDQRLVEPILWDPASDESVARAIGEADAVVNLVGILYESGADTFERVHVGTAARIARMAAVAPNVAGFVHLSALGANAMSGSLYARSKVAGESAVLAAFPAAVILRPSIVFGPEDNFFNLFARLARFSPVLPLIGGGRTRFQPVYVANVADAAIAALQKPHLVGKIFELGGPQVYSFRELLELMLRETGRRRWLAPLPWWFAKLQAAVLERLPAPLLTRDQVELLRADNVIADAKTLTLKDLGVVPMPLETILPLYLKR